MVQTNSDVAVTLGLLRAPRLMSEIGGSFLTTFRSAEGAPMPTLCHLRGQATFFVVPCGSITNFFAAPLSKSLYPCGASPSEIMVALQALAG